MAHVSHRLSNSFEGALAGGGDPATSPLYIFGPFLRLIVVAGVAQVTFGASVWLVVLTVATVSAMYRQVMTWVTDGSGGSGLNEEEFGSWAVKVNAGITFVEYTLTFLVSMAALVTFIADRYPVLNAGVLGFQYRTLIAIALSVITGWLVNRGPRMAARAFGPATFAVLLLLWAMVVAVVWKLGFHLPQVDWRAFSPGYLHFTLGGFARLLALMTGIEVFANLVAAYAGGPAQKSRRAFGSLLIVMGTTSVTMLVVGPAILQLSDPANQQVSVFTQTMDQLLPAPLAYMGTVIGIIVLGSASAASAQGLQNLALGLRYRQYIPAVFGQRNRFDVADKPVWFEVGVVSVCYLLFGTHEETYLAIYAAGVFILLSMTGWAAAKRLTRNLRKTFAAGRLAALGGTLVAALLTSAATVIIFVERFSEGAWTYFLFVPALYAVFSYYRSKLGEPVPLDDHLGRLLVGQYLLPYQREKRPELEAVFRDILLPLDGSSAAEHAIPVAEMLCRAYGSKLTLISVSNVALHGAGVGRSLQGQGIGRDADLEIYGGQVAAELHLAEINVEHKVVFGAAPKAICSVAQDIGSDLIIMTTHGRSGVQRLFVSDVTGEVIRQSEIPILLIRPTEEWRSRRTQFMRLLVGLDGSGAAEQVLRYARALAQKFGSEILVLGVPEADSEESSLREYVEKVAGALRARNLRARAVVTGSGPARTLVAVSEAEQVDLVLMATHGRGGTERGSAVGSVAERAIQTAQCPMLLVPAGRRRELL